MKLLVSGATATMRRYADSCKDVLGVLVVPGAKNDPQKNADMGLSMAADNGAFSGLDEEAFTRMLQLYRDARIKLLWVACPDVVADGMATLMEWAKWSWIIEDYGFRPCMVLQDGMDIETVIAFDPPAVFVGGSTEFKLGSVAADIVRWARASARPAHMGRVNTKSRIEYAYSLGCTSVDGSGFSKWPDIRIPLGIRWIREAKAKALTQGE